MSESGELSIAGELLERPTFEHRFVVLDVLEYFGLKDKETAVDPCLARWRLLEKRFDVVTNHRECAKTRWGPHRGYGCEFTVRPMKREELPRIHVRQAVTIGGHEGDGAKPARKPTQAAPGLGPQARVDHVDAPVGPLSIVDRGGPAAKIDRQVAVSWNIV